MLSVSSINTQCRKPRISFEGGANAKQASKLPKEVIEKFGLNMKCRAGYNGEPEYMPAPDSVGTELAQIFRKMKVNWLTHVKS